MKKIFLFLALLTITISAQRYTSTTNSSKVLLAGNATFAGGSEKATDNHNIYAYNWINVTVKSAQSGAGKVYQSKDGTTWDHVTAFTHTGGDTLTNTTSVPIILDYFKVTYTNGASVQTTFRLTTVLTNGLSLTTVQSGGSTLATQLLQLHIDSLVKIQTDTIAARFTRQLAAMTTLNAKSMWTNYSTSANQAKLYSKDSMMVANQTNGNQVLQLNSSSNSYGTVFTTAGTNPDSIIFGFTPKTITVINDGVSTDSLFVSAVKTFPSTNRLTRTGGEGFSKAWAVTKIYFKVGTTPLASKKIRVEAQ